MSQMTHVLIIAAVLGAGLLFMVEQNKAEDLFSAAEPLTLSAALGKSAPKEREADGLDRVGGSAPAEPLITTARELTQKFEHKPIGFSFLYPEGFTVGQFKEGEGEVFLLQNEDAANGFQLYILPYDEPAPITEARIQRDLPDLVIENPQRVVIGADQIDALIFEGEDPVFGNTREVWFVAQGHVFQFITYRGNDQFIGPLLETLDFN